MDMFEGKACRIFCDVKSGLKGASMIFASATSAFIKIAYESHQCLLYGVPYPILSSFYL